MKNLSSIRAIMLFAAIAMLPNIGLAQNNVIIVKGGSFNMDDTSQSIDLFPSTVTANFDDDGGLFSVEYDYMMNKNLSIGGGIELSSIDYTSSAGSGDMDLAFITFNTKYHFLDGDFKPFIGGAIGAASTDFNGGIIGSSSGLALGFMAGLRYQFSVVGLYLEYKNYFSADTEDSANAEVDVAGDGIFAGIAINF